MAPTIKDSPGSSTDNKAALSPRSNPVCLEVGVTLRSAPGESGSSQSIREECKTVIVFDNGAVLRSSGQLPAGQTVILSHAGREVVCRVANGHNLPSIKGYAEVEFLEPVSDFWSIHTETAPAFSSTPSSSVSVSRAPAAPPPVPSRATLSSDAPVASSVPSGRGPSFEDIPGLVTTSTTVTTRESKPESPRPVLNTGAKGASDYSHSEMADPTSLASWDAPSSGIRADMQAIPMIGEANSGSARASAPTHDFMSQGLMAYEKPDSTGGSMEGRVPLLLGIAALVLAGIGAVVFAMHRNSGPESPANKSANSQSSPVSAPVAPPAQQPLEQAVREAGDAAARAPVPAQPAAIEQDLPLSTFSPLPAVVKSPATVDSNAEPRNDSRTAKRPEKSAAKQPEPAAARLSAIPNLKMATPSSPARNLANAGDASAPATEIAAAEPAAGVPSANLLTAAGRTSAPPPAPAASFASANPPPPAPAFKAMRPAQLISSARPAYPAAAKESNVQGTVTVSASIDATGKVVTAMAVSGPMMLRQPAADSVKLWKYSPALVDGKPAPTQVTVAVEFRLN